MMCDEFDDFLNKQKHRVQSRLWRLGRRINRRTTELDPPDEPDPEPYPLHCPVGLRGYFPMGLKGLRLDELDGDSE